MPSKIKRPLPNKSFSINPRKGIVGDWKNIFSKEDLIFFKERTK